MHVYVYRCVYKCACLCMFAYMAVCVHVRVRVCGGKGDATGGVRTSLINDNGVYKQTEVGQFTRIGYGYEAGLYKLTWNTRTVYGKHGKRRPILYIVYIYIYRYTMQVYNVYMN